MRRPETNDSLIILRANNIRNVKFKLRSRSSLVHEAGDLILSPRRHALPNANRGRKTAAMLAALPQRSQIGERCRRSFSVSQARGPD